MQKMLTTAEVAEVTGLPVSTLKFWRTKKAAADGSTGPRFAQLGRRVMYREADVVAWVDAQFEAA